MPGSGAGQTDKPWAPVLGGPERPTPKWKPSHRGLSVILGEPKALWARRRGGLYPPPLKTSDPRHEPGSTGWRHSAGAIASRGPSTRPPGVTLPQAQRPSFPAVGNVNAALFQIKDKQTNRQTNKQPLCVRVLRMKNSVKILCPQIFHFPIF